MDSVTSLVRTDPPGDAVNHLWTKNGLNDTRWEGGELSLRVIFPKIVALSSLHLQKLLQGLGLTCRGRRPVLDHRDTESSAKKLYSISFNLLICMFNQSILLSMKYQNKLWKRCISVSQFLFKNVSEHWFKKKKGALQY